MEYLDLFKKLEESNVRYLICGGLAVNIYGIPRMTADIDLLLDFERNNIDKFESILKSLNYQPSLPISLSSLSDEVKRKELKKEKNLIAFSFFNSISNIMSVDVLMESPLGFEEMWNQREVRAVEKYQVNLVSVKHLIEMKKFTGRSQDEQDIVQLTKYYL